MRPVQFFSAEYLKNARKASPTQIVKFLDDYRRLHANAEFKGPREPTKLISIRLSVGTLSKLKSLARSQQTPYQTLMKKLIEDALDLRKVP